MNDVKIAKELAAVAESIASIGNITADEDRALIVYKALRQASDLLTTAEAGLRVMNVEEKFTPNEVKDVKMMMRELKRMAWLAKNYMGYTHRFVK